MERDLDSAVLRLSQRNESKIARGIRDVTQVRVAELMGLSPSVLSEYLQKHQARIASLLAASGLKVVECTAEVYEESYIRSLKTLAAHGISGDNGLADDL